MVDIPAGHFVAIVARMAFCEAERRVTAAASHTA
jgi:hypothetical protein